VGIAVIAIAAILIALLAIDRLLAMIAARMVAGRLRHASRAAAAPDVRVAGGLFVPQLLAGRYRAVDIKLADFAVGGLGFSGLVARLTSVRAPVSSWLDDHQVTAGQVTAMATLPLAILRSKLPPGLTLRANGGELTIRGPALLMPVSAALSIDAARHAISVVPKVLGVPSLVGFSIALPGLPEGMEIESADVTDMGVRLHLRGADVILAGGNDR
jgi:hypothetical protein